MDKLARKCPAAFVLAAAVLWGSIGLFVRGLDTFGFTSMEIVLMRCAITAVVLFFYGCAANRSIFRIRFRDIWCFLGTGILSILFFNYCYVASIARTSMAIAAVLLYTAPCFVIILSAFLFKEKITAKKSVSLVLAFLGCVCVSGAVGNMEGFGFWGFLLGIGSGIGYALYSIFGKYALMRGYSSITITFYTFLIAALGSIPFVSLGKLAGKIGRYPQSMAFFAGLAVFVTVVAYIAYTLGLNHMENGRASIIACVEPAMATVLGMLVYREKLDIFSFVGLLLVVGSTVLVNVNWQARRIAPAGGNKESVREI